MTAPSTSGRYPSKLVELFGADLRSLAAFRIVLALLALGDILARATNLTAHYSDIGILPRTALIEEVAPRWTFSLHLGSGEPLVQAVLFAVQAVAAVALLIGFRSRAAVTIVWLLTVSLNVRNPMVLSDADLLLRMLLFWAMFLPLDARWSVASMRGTGLPQRPLQYLSVATVGLFAQIVFVYIFTTILKSGPEWRTDGSALYYALSLKQFSTPAGEFVRQFFVVTQVLTFATLALELLGPLLLFSPVLTGPVRTFGVLAFAGLHVGIRLNMSIGLFPWVAALCMVCFLPAWFWDRLAGPLVSRAGLSGRSETTWQHRLSTGVLARLSLLREVLASPGPLLNRAGAGVWGGTTNPKTSHGLALSTISEGASGASVPTVGTGKIAALEGGSRVLLERSLALNLLAGFFLVLVFWWNVSTVTTIQLPEPLANFASVLRLNQKWNMFAPSPGKTSHQYRMPGTLVGGAEVDLSGVLEGDLRVRGPRTPEEAFALGGFKDHRWEKYLSQIGRDENRELRLHLGRFICREWNGEHAGDDRVRRFRIYSVSRTALPDYQQSELKQRLLWSHRCF